MNRFRATDTSILIASDKISDAKLIKKLLDADFDKVSTSTDPDKAVVDFDRQRPDVLILAFDTLEKSERYYLGLYRQGGAIHLNPHRTIILTHKDEMQRVYKLCRDGIFDDYNLFWPMSNDPHRLSMSVLLAARELATTVANVPTVAEFATRARGLATLEDMFSEQMTQCDVRIDSVRLAASRVRECAGLVVDNFLQRLTGGELQKMINVSNVDKLRQEMGRLKHEVIEASLQSQAESVQSLKQWTSEFRGASTPYLKSARSLNVLVESVQLKLLVVDDDEFQHKIISAFLKDENYYLLFATGGIDALHVLRKDRPDLILMDVDMPGMNGVEIARQIKAEPSLAAIPVLMITGKSDKAIVEESLKAGASGFIVKPVKRGILLDKLKQILTS